MRPIKRKTYTNFISIMNYLVREKHYAEREAERLTHQVFDNMESAPGSDAWTFATRILAKEDYEAEYTTA